MSKAKTGRVGKTRTPADDPEDKDFKDSAVEGEKDGPARQGPASKKKDDPAVTCEVVIAALRARKYPI